MAEIKKLDFYGTILAELVQDRRQTREALVGHYAKQDFDAHDENRRALLQ